MPARLKDVPNRKTILAVLIALMSACLLSCNSARAQDAGARKPNVLVVMTDDQGYGDVTSHGNNYLQTPHHDQIAASGARFDRFFVSPVCAPTRASLLTGRWHLRTGVHGVTRGRENMRAEEVTIAEVFARAGYRTAAVGKWHNGGHYPEHPLGQGFEEFYGFCAGHFNNYFNSKMERNGKLVPFEGFMIDRQTDYAIDFIKRNQSEPWFCYVAFNTPHSPWQVPEPYWQRYANRDDLDMKAKCAYAMVENIDDNLGRMLAVLDEQRVAQDTIVVFLTDNGANSDRYNAGMKGRKGSLHEGGTRVPCFLRYPRRVPANQTVAPIAAHIDLLPTLCELANVEPPTDTKLDGQSLVPLITGDSSEWPARTLFAHWGDDANGTPRGDRGAVRTDQYRAVMYNSEWQLFDMLADPSQKKDIAANEPEVLESLREQYAAWFQETTRDGFAPLPIQVGHAAAPSAQLRGHEALLSPAVGKGIRYNGRAGWANDWVTGWADPKAFASWPIHVVAPGSYRVTIEYSATAAQANNVIQVASDGEVLLESAIETPAEAVPIESPDRVKRGEVYEFVWGVRELGVVQLEAGEQSLEIRAGRLTSPTLMQLKSVTLARQVDTEE